MRHCLEQQVFIPGDVEIVVNKDIVSVEVSMHQWKMKGVRGQREILFFGLWTMDQAIDRVECREVPD
jgi:hypothetical protein